MKVPFAALWDNMRLQRALLPSMALVGSSLAAAEDLAQFALTDTGSIDGGNTFPGVARPLGIVKLGPDLYTGTDAYSGYQPTGNFTGFTMLHESGTGGAPKYGVVSQMPVLGNVENPLSDAMNDTRAQPDFTEVGYYKASLGSGTILELAATRKAGLYQYTFPETGENLNVLVDVSHVLSSYRGQGLGQHFLGGNISVHIEEDSEGPFYTGSGTYDNGWNRAGPWTVFFCGKFNAPFLYKTFLGADFISDTLVEFSTEKSYESDSARLGALFTFNETSVLSRVGVSFISEVQACTNLDSEIPRERTLADVRQETRDTWTAEVFSKVTTTDTNVTKRQQLYTALYFMHLLPTNKTGENPYWESNEPYYDDIFTFWDIPKHYNGLLRSMIDIWRQGSWISDARSSFHNGAIQGGTNGDIVLADALSKGVTENINWSDALQAVLKNGDEVPPNNNDPRDPTGATNNGRSALPDWIELGFITPDFGRSVSRAVEYSVNDYAIATIALHQCELSEFDRFFERSKQWRNHWNPDMKALNFTGFLGPRDTDGFIAQDPLSCGGCYWADYYYQGLPWEYSFNAHHDVDTIIELCGGPDKFVERLELTFQPGIVGGNGDFGHTIFNPGNQPSFTTPYLYSYANRQDLTVKRSRFIAKSYYAPKPDGLPGNSDAGSMESWLLWNMIGMYPMTGQPFFFIGSPWFSDLTIDLGNGKKLVITAEGGAEDRYYVQSLKINGRDWNKGWVTWDDIFAEGGTLEFVLGNATTLWTTGETPPSPGSPETGVARNAAQC